MECQFIKSDFYKLEDKFGKGSFDIALSIQTLSWLPSYNRAVEQLLAVSRKWVFITSLFSDFFVDVITNVHQYPDQDWDSKVEPFNYNIYSIDRFSHFCMKNGAKEVHHEDFVIDIDLTKPKEKVMGTYTIKDKKGSRMQFSGPLYMPWKFVAIKK